MSRKGKSLETESRLGVLGGGRAKGDRVSLGGNENVLKLIVVDRCATL